MTLLQRELADGDAPVGGDVCRVGITHTPASSAQKNVDSLAGFGFTFWVWRDQLNYSVY